MPDLLPVLSTLMPEFPATPVTVEPETQAASPSPVPTSTPSPSPLPTVTPTMLPIDSANWFPCLHSKFCTFRCGLRMAWCGRPDL